MNLVSLKCPNCGATLNLQVYQNLKQAYCAHCGARLLIDDGTRKVVHEYVNAERAGYEFEKGRQCAQAEAAPQQVQYVPVYQEPVRYRKRHTFWWVVGWILIFPLPLTILILRKNIHWIAKILIVIAAWALYFGIFYFNGQASKSVNVAEPQTA